MSATDYAKKAEQWGKALKLLDPSLILILCGLDGVSPWDFEVLNTCITYIDMHSIHMYTSSNDHLPNATAPLAAERAIESAAALIDIARIHKNIPPTAPRPKICFDEWNVWDPQRAPGDKGAEESYTLSDALAVGVWLNVFVRQSKWVGMANIAQSVNVISPLMTTKEGIIKQTIWWPLLLFTKYMRGWTIGVHLTGSAYDGKTQPAWLHGTLEDGASWLDVSASVNADGVVSLSVVNIHEEKDFEVKLDGVGKAVKVYTVTGENINSSNMKGTQDVGIKESQWDGEGSFKFPKLSVTMLRWETGKKIAASSKTTREALDTRSMAWVSLE